MGLQDLQVKISELNGQLQEMKKLIQVQFMIKIQYIKDKIDEYETVVRNFIAKGVDWVKRHIVIIRQYIAKTIQWIRDQLKKVQDWIKKQLEVVEDWIAKQIEKLTKFVEDQINAINDFIKKKTEEAAEKYAELQVKAKLA